MVYQVQCGGEDWTEHWVKRSMIAAIVALFTCVFIARVEASPFDCETASHRHNDGEYREAIRLYTNCIRSVKNTANRRTLALFYTLRGRSHLKLEDFESAESDFKRALRKSKKQKRTYYSLGNFKSIAGNHVEAIEAYEKAIELDAEYAPAYVALALDLHAIGDYQRAIEVSEKAIALNPNDPFAYNNMGNAYDGLGQFVRAIELYDRAIALNSDYALAYYNRGLVQGKLHQYSKAIADYEKSIQLDSEDPRVHNSLAWLLATATDSEFINVEKAFIHVTKSIPLNENSKNRDTLAAVHAQKGNFKEAAKNQERAIELLVEEGRTDAVARYTARLTDYQNSNLPDFDG